MIVKEIRMENRMNPGDVVRHFKGNEYEILCYALDSETQEELSSIVRSTASAAHGCGQRTCSFPKWTGKNIRMLIRHTALKRL